MLPASRIVYDNFIYALPYCIILNEMADYVVIIKIYGRFVYERTRILWRICIFRWN